MSTPIKTSKNTPRKPSSAARILEKIELLVALHEKQGESKSSDFSELLNQKAVEITTSLEEKIDERLTQLESRIEKLSQLPSQLPGTEATNAANSLDQVTAQELVAESALEVSSALESHFDSKFSSLESQVEKLSQAIAQDSPTDSTSLWNEQASRELADEKFLEISSSLESHLDTRFKAQAAEILGAFDKQSLLFQTIQATQPDNAGDFESQRTMIESTFKSMAEGFRDRTDAIAILLHTKIEDTFQELDLKISQIPQGQGEPRDHGEPQPLEPEPIIDTASHWHRQKEAMLSKYGIDPDYRPLMELPQTTSADSSESPSVDSQAIEGLQNSASELS
jgi:hypothetical protein